MAARQGSKFYQMKKIQLNSAKLQLKKDKIANLTNDQMNEVNGGFTYSLSTGQRCRVSKAVGAADAYECGAIVSAAVCGGGPVQPANPGLELHNI